MFCHRLCSVDCRRTTNPSSTLSSVFHSEVVKEWFDVVSVKVLPFVDLKKYEGQGLFTHAVRDILFNGKHFAGGMAKA